METVGSKRSRELRKHLGELFVLDEGVVSAALMLFIGSIHDRLSRSVEVSLVSWIPETWGFLNKDGRDLFGDGVRGVEALEERVEAAGIPAKRVGAFISELMAFLDRRCGRPLADSMRRKIPEIAEIERNHSLLESQADLNSSDPTDLPLVEV